MDDVCYNNQAHTYFNWDQGMLFFFIPGCFRGLSAQGITDVIVISDWNGDTY